MATTTFVEPGGDATFDMTLWSTFGTPAVASDFVHGGHQRSIKFRANNDDEVFFAGSAADAGTRATGYYYFNALPAANLHFIQFQDNTGSTAILGLVCTSAGVLKLVDSANTQIGSNGATLSAGNWYRIAICYTITSTTVNSFRVYVSAAGGGAGVLSITADNATIATTGTFQYDAGNTGPDTTMDLRLSDVYIDNSSALTDPGDVWVTAKRPFGNGTTNGFTTQIGSGGSGYPASGGGHAPQVNERPVSQTNGWSMVGAGSAVTEEYAIEGQAVGDLSTSGGTIIDFMGWLSGKSLSSETGKIIVAGVSTNISLTSTVKVFKKIAGSSTYPAGGTDIGIITTTALTTVSLYECGIVVAYIPAAVTASTSPHLMSMMGMGS